MLVQPLLVTTLLFALPLAAWWSGRRLSRADAAWALVLSAALALFVVVAEPTAGVDRAAPAAWLPAGVVLGVLLCGCLAGAAVRRGAVRAVLLAVVTAVLYGLTAALTKGVVSLLDDGPLALVTAWETPALVLAAVGGTLASQSAFQAGGLGASLPIITVGEPLVGGRARGGGARRAGARRRGGVAVVRGAGGGDDGRDGRVGALRGRPSGGPLRRRLDAADGAWARAARPSTGHREEALGARVAQPHPRQVHGVPVGQHPRQPLRAELRVEVVQRLDLEERVEQPDRPPGEPLRAA